MLRARLDQDFIITPAAGLGIQADLHENCPNGCTPGIILHMNCEDAPQLVVEFLITKKDMLDEIIDRLQELREVVFNSWD